MYALRGWNTILITYFCPQTRGP